MQVLDPNNILDVIDNFIKKVPFSKAFKIGQSGSWVQVGTKFKDNLIHDAGTLKTAVEIVEIHDEYIELSFSGDGKESLEKYTKEEYEKHNGNELRNYFSDSEGFKIPNDDGQKDTVIILRDYEIKGNEIVIDTLVQQKFSYKKDIAESRILYTVKNDSYGIFQFSKLKLDMGVAWSNEWFE